MALGAQIPILSSLVDLRELVLDCFDACEVHTVVEIGADTGAFTAVLGKWAQTRSGRVHTVESAPSSRLLNLLGQLPAVQLVTGRSPDCLGAIEACDAYVIDGDHNYHTVSRELSAIVARTDDHRLPLIILHDVAWPWGRRDSYYSPDLLPKDGVRPHTFTGGVSPRSPGISEDGVVNAGLWAVALEEGGDKNGVQTAADDFLATDARFGYIVIPCIFGLGVMYPRAAPYAGALQTLLGPLRDHPLLRRLEDNRLELILVAQESQRLTEQNRLTVEDHERIVAERDAWIAEKRRYDSEARSTIERLKLLTEQAEIADKKHAETTQLAAHLARAQHELDLIRVDRDRTSLLLLDAEQAHSRLVQQVAERDSTLTRIVQSRSWRIVSWLQVIRRRCHNVLVRESVRSEGDRAVA